MNKSHDQTVRCYAAARVRRAVSAVVPAVMLSLIAPATVVGQAGTWTRLDNAPHRFQGRFDDTYFVAPDTGWVVSTAGHIFRTTNGGREWDTLVDGSLPDIGNPGFRSVGFVNAMHGFVGALSFNNLLFETTDGGETWTNISDRIRGASPQGICGISVVDENNIFAVGRYSGPAIFLKTSNGGQTWLASSLSPLAETLIDVHFFNENEGIAVGGISNNLSSGNRAVILSTSDGGDTWTRRHVTDGPTSEWGWKITFPTRFTGYVSVEYAGSRDTPAKVLKTTNGGMKWQEYEIGSSQESLGLQGIGFVSVAVGWAGGRGTTSQTVVGADSWQTFGTIDGNVNRFRFLGDSVGYAVGQYIYKYTAAGSNGVDDSSRESDLEIQSVYPQPTDGPVVIRYRQRNAGQALAAVYDAVGRRVADLRSTEAGEGEHEVLWDPRADGAIPKAGGVYFVRISAGGSVTQAAVVVTSVE